MYLTGYDIVRFGGDEFRSVASARTMLLSCFRRLFIMHGYDLENARDAADPEPHGQSPTWQGLTPACAAGSIQSSS